MKKYAELYDEMKALKAQYRAGEKTEVVEALKAEYNELMAEVKTCPAGACKAWRFYEKARRNGNLRPDVDDILWDEEVPAFVDALRAGGCESFTFSSTWSGAVQTAYLLTQLGCKLEGLILINDDVVYGEPAKKPAYLFSL